MYVLGSRLLGQGEERTRRRLDYIVWVTELLPSRSFAQSNWHRSAMQQETSLYLTVEMRTTPI